MTDRRDFLPMRLTVLELRVGRADLAVEMDPLADVLDLSCVRGGLRSTVFARAPWGLELSPVGGAALHSVTCGTGWLRVEGEGPRQLMPGDVVLLPTGNRHRLSSGPATRCEPFNREMKKRRMTAAGDLTIGSQGAQTSFVCAAYDYDLDVAQPLMSLLPKVMHVPADPVSGRSVAAIVELLAGEVGARSPGARAAVGRLIDLLLIEAIRRWVSDEAEPRAPSWLAALHDPTIARALALLHARPAQPWTLQALASEVHLSRAPLARRFTETVGEPPSRT
jgi:Cupin